MSNPNPPHVDVEQVPEGDDRVNAQADPAGNYPDADRGEAGPLDPPTTPAPPDPAPVPPHRPEGADHHGQDGDRGTLTAGESQRLLGEADAQTLPAMDQNNASPIDKLHGIIEQTVADAAFQPRERLGDHLRQRIDDAGLTITDEGFAAALAAVESTLDGSERR